MKELFINSIFAIFLSCRLVLAHSAPLVYPNEVPPYHLVVGSYTNFETARNIAAAYQKKGYKSYIVFPEPGTSTYRVSVFQSNDKAAIDAFSKTFTKQSQTKGWVYSPKTTQAIRTVESQGIKTFQPSRSGSNEQTLVYYLIVGSFSSYESAEIKVSELALKGYEPDILVPTANSPSYKVFVFVTDIKEQIDAYISKNKSRIEREKGWVFEQTGAYINYGQGRGETAKTPVNAKVTSAYYLIGASLATQAAATDFAKKVRDLGYYPTILAPDKSSKYYRVSIYHHSDREILEYFKKQNYAKGIATNSWILQK